MSRQIINPCDLFCQKKHSQDTSLKLLKHYVLIEQKKKNYLVFVSSQYYIWYERSFVSTQVHNADNLLLNIWTNLMQNTSIWTNLLYKTLATARSVQQTQSTDHSARFPLQTWCGLFSQQQGARITRRFLIWMWPLWTSLGMEFVAESSNHCSLARLCTRL